MRLCVQNLKPLEQPVTYAFTVEEASPVGYMSYLSGTTSISLTDCHGVRHGIDNTAGECALCHLPGSYGESLAEPPSLQALARRVGLTHTRLSAVFQLLLGHTVFGYLREKRLERARRLLETPRRGVTETAYDCGFSSPSHFTRAFTRR